MQYDLIGKIEMGIDGYDSYFQVKSEFDKDRIKQWANSHFRFDANGPGRLFCSFVEVTQFPYCEHYIIRACYRYDI